MPDLQRAVEKLYEDAVVRDELRDAEAKALLQWAESQLNRLAETGDETTFDQQASTLRTVLKGVNRLMGRRAELDAQTRKSALTALLDQASVLGAQPDFAAIDTFLDQLPTLEDSAALTGLLALLTPGSAPATVVPESSDEPQTTALALPDEDRQYPGRTPLYALPARHSGESTPDGETQNDEHQP